MPPGCETDYHTWYTDGFGRPPGTVDTLSWSSQPSTATGPPFEQEKHRVGLRQGQQSALQPPLITQQSISHNYNSIEQDGCIDPSAIFRKIEGAPVHDYLQQQYTPQLETTFSILDYLSYAPPVHLMTPKSNDGSGSPNLDDFYRSPYEQSEQEMQSPCSDALAQTPKRRRTTRSATRPSRPASAKQRCKQRLTNGEFCKINATLPNEYCYRHQKKVNRKDAPPPVFHMRPGIDFDTAYEKLYAEFPPLNLPGDDYELKTEHEWVDEFIQAASTPYVAPDDEANFYSRQQIYLNGKAFDGNFDDEVVTERMRLLYKTAYRFHTGGKPPYPRGGDSGGYGKPDETTLFSTRLNNMINILTIDKRVVLNVLMGRGVLAFVCNPLKFEGRKRSNEHSNGNRPKLATASEHNDGDDTEDGDETDNGGDTGENEEACHNPLKVVQAPATPEQTPDIEPDFMKHNLGKRKRECAPRASTAQSPAKARPFKQAKGSVGRSRKT